MNWKDFRKPNRYIKKRMRLLLDNSFFRKSLCGAQGQFHRRRNGPHIGSCPPLRFLCHQLEI